MIRGLLLISLISISMSVNAGPTDDNHVHVEQVGSGDDLELNIDQMGYGNTIEFSFDHSGNIFNLSQSGNDNYIGWVSYWGSGKSWGGDVDGVNNNEAVMQLNGATYGRHIWGNNNDVDIYQNGTHTHNLDIHVSNVDHDVWQDGQGSHYNQTYFYGSTHGSDTNVSQTGDANHNSQIRIYGNQPVTLNLTQQGSTNQSYNLNQSCYTTGGCSITVTQGN